MHAGNPKQMDITRLGQMNKANITAILAGGGPPSGNVYQPRINAHSSHEVS